MRTGVVVLVVIFFLPYIAHGGHREITRHRVKPPRAVMAEGIRFINPSNRVAFVCRECGESLPKWALGLGTALDSRGFVMVPLREETAELIIKGQKTTFMAILWVSPPVQGKSSDTTGTAIPVIPINTPIDDTTIPYALSALENLAGSVPTGLRPVRYLFITSGSSELDQTLSAQLSWVVHYAKLDADFLDIASVGSLPAVTLWRYAVVGLAVSSFPRAHVARFARFAREYVERGGRLAALGGVPDTEFLDLLGIKEVGAEEPLSSYTCDDGFVPGSNGLVFGAGEADKLQSLTLKEGVQVLCSSSASLPMVFSFNVGAGRTLTLNGIPVDKSGRGILLASLLEVGQPAAAATMGALLFFIDDCPLPVRGEMVSPVDSLYGMTDADFYLKLWLPSMSDIFTKYKIRPTFAFMTTYSDQVKEPFDDSGFGEGDDPSFRLARVVASIPQSEVGLHGYNHQSLAVGASERTVGWPGREAMEAALRKARSEFMRVLGGLPKVYIAPNNYIEKLGKLALLNVFPEIGAISTQYLDEDSILGQEFGPDPDMPDIQAIPRISSEYFLEPDNVLEILSALILPGVLSHFIHPDDIFDPERSKGKRFEELVHSLDQLLSRVDSAYPFLRRLNASDFAAELKAYLNSKLEISSGPEGLVLRVSNPPPFGLLVYVRVRHGVKASGCENVWHGSSRYYFRVTNTPCILKWE